MLLQTNESNELVLLINIHQATSTVNTDFMKYCHEIALNSFAGYYTVRLPNQSIYMEQRCIRSILFELKLCSQL